MGNELLALQETLYTSRNPTRRWLHGIRREWIRAAIAEAGPQPDGHALEIGPGSCVYLPELLTQFGRVTASDIEASFLERARALDPDENRLQTVVDDITRSGLQRGSFDLILCTEVVEHVRDSAGAIATMFRLLKPGGLLVLSTPHRCSSLEMVGRIALTRPFIHLTRLIYREPVLEPGHINLMTPSGVERQLYDAGFDIRRRHSSGLYVPVLAELGGDLAVRISSQLERKLRGSWLDWLLWTQYYIAIRPQAVGSSPG
jgi:SAM-dependent methyltransferase